MMRKVTIWVEKLGEASTKRKAIAENEAKEQIMIGLTLQTMGK